MSRWILVAVAAVAVIAAFLLPTVPQDPAYHAFADRSALLGVPNFWNVASNLPFLLVGAWGLGATPTALATIPRPAYLLFCLGVLLVGIGSAYYHYAPTSDTLVWDRLPMTIAFMALFSIVIGDRISAPLGRRLLWPLVLAGVVAVMYWDWTELQGQGDLRPYGLVQFLPMAMIPLMLVSERGNGLRASWLWATLATYGLAKLAEHYDSVIHLATGAMSGHTLKHLLGALAGFLALRAMRDPVHH
ncbi:MAG: ceramidase domain-containing protein [Chromatiales bacterium]|nr:ceramidase domain-containing protein [Chromatiales bacterium]